jgi:formylglycine-generating enzyme required for sulfatase activity
VTRSKAAALAVAVVVVALLSGSFVWWLAARPAMPRIEWVDVPAGELLMGADPEADPDAFSSESPRTLIVLDAYRIGRHEVTNAQYARCVRAGACGEPGRTEQYGDPRYRDHPAVHVTWYDAQTFCNWVGGRLPTEAEWEYAARGPEGTIFPWGNELDGASLNFCDANCASAWAEQNIDDGYAGTAPVGSYPQGASWCGAQDMAGNVWEWTTSLYRPYPYQADDGREEPTSTGSRVLRGGAFGSKRAGVRTTYRNHVERAHSSKVDYGLRCVMDVPF